jgi:hypothetical protein
MSHDMMLSVVAPILMDIEGIVLDLNCFVIQHVNRSANTSAHLCAKLVSQHDESDCWMNSVPNFLTISIQADSAGSMTE